MAAKRAAIAADLRRKITEGTWTPGDLLPPSRQLAAEHSVSRPTISYVFDTLAREGLIEYLPAHQAYQVARPKRRRRMTRARLSADERAAGRGFFLSDAHGAGATPDVTTVVTTVQASDDVAARLEIEPGADVIQRDRVMRLDGEPAQLATGSIPAPVASGTAIEHENPGPGGVVERLRELGHEITTHIERVVPGRSASDDEARDLNIDTGALVCEITRVSYTAAREPVLTELIILPAASVELVYEMAA